MIENNAPNAIDIWRIHQNGPCEPMKSELQRNSLVWKTTLSMSSSNRSMPIVLERSEIKSAIPPVALPVPLACNNSDVNIIFKLFIY